jgi:hypothetical protein
VQDRARIKRRVARSDQEIYHEIKRFSGYKPTVFTVGFCFAKNSFRGSDKTFKKAIATRKKM